MAFKELASSVNALGFSTVTAAMVGKMVYLDNHWLELGFFHYFPEDFVNLGVTAQLTVNHLEVVSKP